MPVSFTIVRLLLKHFQHIESKKTRQLQSKNNTQIFPFTRMRANIHFFPYPRRVNQSTTRTINSSTRIKAAISSNYKNNNKHRGKSSGYKEVWEPMAIVHNSHERIRIRRKKGKSSIHNGKAVNKRIRDSEIERERERGKESREEPNDYTSARSS